jgi:hypothetical protein
LFLVAAITPEINDKQDDSTTEAVALLESAKSLVESAAVVTTPEINEKNRNGGDSASEAVVLLEPEIINKLNETSINLTLKENLVVDDLVIETSLLERPEIKGEQAVVGLANGVQESAEVSSEEAAEVKPEVKLPVVDMAAIEAAAEDTEESRGEIRGKQQVAVTEESGPEFKLAATLREIKDEEVRVDSITEDFVAEFKLTESREIKEDVRVDSITEVFVAEFKLTESREIKEEVRVDSITEDFVAEFKLTESCEIKEDVRVDSITEVFVAEFKLTESREIKEEEVRVDSVTDSATEADMLGTAIKGVGTLLHVLQVRVCYSFYQKFSKLNTFPDQKIKIQKHVLKSLFWLQKLCPGLVKMDVFGSFLM